MANIFDFANFFIDLSLHNEEDPMTNLRLNKLLYFAQGCSFAKRGVPLFCEDFRAWKFGPVVPVVYHEFKKYEANPIDKVVGTYSPSVFSEDEFDILLNVANEYGKYTSPTLVDISHIPQGPWDIAYRHCVESVIPKSDIKEYFQTNSCSSRFNSHRDSIQTIYGRRDKDGYLVLPKELGSDWAL
jgi:uncharacterized phage-associated protein